MSTQRTSDFQIVSNDRLNATVWRMRLAGDTSHIQTPGQFVNVQLPGLYLRRPISVCDVEGDVLTLVYRVVGKGTELMADMRAGEKLNLLTGLGNGYDLSLAGDRPLLVGGGVGTPPLLLLAKRLLDKSPTVALGFASKDDIILKEDFEALGIRPLISTADGSYGIKGVATDVVRGMRFSHFYACGPYVMLKALATELDCGGSVSMEERMGCGFGACMGCSIQLANGGVKRVCKEGPVFDAKEILWK